MSPLLALRKALYLLLLLATGPVPGQAEQGAREAMADAMSRMMEAMGMFGSAPSELDAAGWGSAANAPWGGSGPARAGTSPMQEMMRQFSRQMAPSGGSGGDWPVAWQPSRLEGVWEGRDGELLIVQGSRFRIYSPAVQRVDGLIEVRGDRLALYNPLDQHAQGFEFAESRGRLIMRDLAGQAYLYRRLRLDGGHFRATDRTSPER